MPNNNSANEKASALKEIHIFFADQLRTLISVTLDLTERAYKTKEIDETSYDQKEKYIETCMQIQSARQQVLDSIDTELAKSLSGEGESDAGGIDELGLSLVDDDSLEESILISNISEHYREKYDLVTRAIKRGFVRISRDLDYEVDPDAFSPKEIGLIFQTSIKKINDLSLEDKNILYDSLRDGTYAKLEQAYSGVLTLMQEYGVLKEKENPSSANFQLIHEFRSKATKLPKPKKVRSQDNQNDLTVSDITAADGTIDSEYVGSNLGSHVQPYSGAPVAATALTEAAFKNNTVSQMIYNLLSSAPQGQAPTDTTDPNAVTIQSDKLINLLSNLQAKQDAQSEKADAPDSVSNLVNNELESITSEEKGQLSNTESKVIELINKLFVAILDDPFLSDPVKAQVGRLQIPYIKVGLLDVSLLNQETHPARLVLNEIAELGVGINDNNSQLLEKIKDIVQSIIDNFESNLNIFAELLEQIREIHDDHAHEAESLEEETLNKAEGQAKLLYIKRMVIQQLRKFLKGKHVPKSIYPLVLRGFAPLFLKRYRKYGENSDQWQDAVELFRQVIESIQPRDSLQELAIVVDRSKEIFKTTQAALGEVVKGEAQAKLLVHLQKIYNEEIAKYEKLKKQDIAEGGDGEVAFDDFTVDPFDYDDPGDLTIDTEIQSQPSPKDIIESMPDHIKPGIWCEVYMGKDKPITFTPI